ncbi:MULTISPECIES: hypothetical protein [Vibrio]|uniref:hypothetical protein n=1 Tax=Vibrio TaxID=662 RepID=UPI002074D350|nr:MULTISPECIES: hypothetical protein [Vibrio]USD33741.1 hypothetical protein J8Z27_06505 [Vibrio sp. SCSIO 43186]USD46812.1 hypothetical protein J4N38_06705 [Vibrio sp. SCSIO 43145]USD70865.1 hypothetical protein J4N41_06505 [Vibrio sp. SCSIO 43139]USD95779.1 hypothetical protein CTT30_06615 [Vibrio coralliilyticus]
MFSVYGGWFKFCGIVGRRLARAFGCFRFGRFLVGRSATSNLSLSQVLVVMWLKLCRVKVLFNWQALMSVAECFPFLVLLVKFVR